MAFRRSRDRRNVATMRALKRLAHVVPLIRRRSVVVLLGACLAVVAASAGLVRSQTVAAAPTYATVRVAQRDIAQSVSATGPVVAPTSEPLNFRVGGRVAEIPVEAGQTVHSGDGLSRLGDSNPRPQFGQAPAPPRHHQAPLAQPPGGATPPPHHGDQKA